MTTARKPWIQTQGSVLNSSYPHFFFFPKKKKKNHSSLFSEAETFSLQLPCVEVPGKHSLCSLELCLLHLFFGLLLQSSDIRPRLLPARVPLGQELQAVCGADGLPEEALLAQHPLDGVILPHLVLLYDLGKWPLVRSWTRRQGGPQQDKSGSSSEEEESQKEHSIQRLTV